MRTNFLQVIPPLQGLIPSCDFLHATDVGVAGMKDEELFDWMADNEYTGILTKDTRQLSDAAERQKLISRGLHWIGRNHDGLRGMKMFASATASYLYAFPFIVDSIQEATEPMMYHIKNLPKEAGQRVKISPLTRPVRSK